MADVGSNPIVGANFLVYMCLESVYIPSIRNQTEGTIMCYKKASLNAAFSNGLRRCPCCNVQLVWKANIGKVQKNLATVDHMVAKSYGGADNADNMFVMCRKCNEERGNRCFVNFVVERNFSKVEAELLYKKAHIASVRHHLGNLILNVRNVEERRKLKGKIKSVVGSYRRYFNDYLPEFDLLPREVCN